MNEGGLFILLIDIVYTEQCSGEGGCFAKGDEEGFVYLALRVNEDAAEEEYEASDGQNCGSY